MPSTLMVEPSRGMAITESREGEEPSLELGRTWTRYLLMEEFRRTRLPGWPMKNLHLYAVLG
jgi:hypothetical protein